MLQVGARPDMTLDVTRMKTSKDQSVFFSLSLLVLLWLLSSLLATLFLNSGDWTVGLNR